MDKNVLTLIGIIAICGTVLFVVDKQTSQSSQSQKNQVTINNQASSHPNFEGYTYMAQSDTVYLYFKNGSQDYKTLNSDSETFNLWGGVVRLEYKNFTPQTELFKFYIKETNIGTYSDDCNNGYGSLHIYTLSNIYKGTSDWASGVHNFYGSIGELLCKEYYKQFGEGILKQKQN